MVSSFVALSTTYSGVVILPISCIQAAISICCNSSSENLIFLYIPWVLVLIFCAINDDSSATLLIWPPVYFDFSLIASAVDLIKSINNFSRPSISLVFVNDTAAWEDIDSIKFSSLLLNVKILSLVSFCLFKSWTTPITLFSWFLIGTTSIEVVLYPVPLSNFFVPSKLKPSSV